jgi:hypothetical protein
MTGGLVRELAKIERTHLGFEDHGILTGSLHVNYGGAGQGIGGYSIATVAGDYIKRTLEACGVRTWEELRGRTIYVLTDSNRRVVGIENLPTEPGGRFLFAEVFGEPS